MIIGGRSCSPRVSKTRKNPPARERGRESRRVSLDETHLEMRLDGKRNREGTLTSAMSRRSIDLLTDSARRASGAFVKIFIRSLIHPRGIPLSFTIPRTFRRAVLSSALSQNAEISCYRSTVADLLYIHAEQLTTRVTHSRLPPVDRFPKSPCNALSPRRGPIVNIAKSSHFTFQLQSRIPAGAHTLHITRINCCARLIVDREYTRANYSRDGKAERTRGGSKLLIYRADGAVIFRQDPHSAPGGLPPPLNKARNAANDK